MPPTDSDHILYCTKDRYSESSVLSTLLNDSLYIIRLNLAKEDDQHPLEIITEGDNEFTLIYNIGNHFIYGISVRKDRISLGRQIATISLTQIKEQFKQVITWAEAESEWSIISYSYRILFDYSF